MAGEAVFHPRCLTALSLLLVLAHPVSAQEPVASPTPPPAWTGSAQVSFLNTSGNTETSVLGLGAEAGYKGVSPWSALLKAAFSRGSLGGEENLRNLGASLRGSRSLDPRTDFFVGLNYAEDIYAGIDSRVGAEAGVSRKLSAEGPHLLALEGGIGFTHEVRLPHRVTQNFAVGRAGFDYKYVISKTADFQNQFNFTANLSDGRDWRVSNLTALTAAINARFSLKASYAVGRFNTPPLGKKKTDTTLSAALVAKF